jgi:hypothetical protein
VSEETPAAVEEIEGLLDRLRSAHRSFIAAVTRSDPERFAEANEDGDSIKRILERSADDVNFYYGQLVAKALALPQPPMEHAQFDSIADAKSALQLAHRRLTRLLNDVSAADLERKARLESTAEYTLRQVLETAVAHYNLRADQLSSREGDR